MPDRPIYKKGDFLVGGACPGRFGPEREDRALRRQFPEFADHLTAVGPSPEEARLAALAAENRKIEQRLAEVKAKVAAFQEWAKRK